MCNRIISYTFNIDFEYRFCMSGWAFWHTCMEHETGTESKTRTTVQAIRILHYVATLNNIQTLVSKTDNHYLPERHATSTSKLAPKTLASARNICARHTNRSVNITNQQKRKEERV